MKSKTPILFRQGDVGLQRVDSIPTGATPAKVDGRIVLAYGEVTGHAHAIYATDYAARNRIDKSPVRHAKLWDAGAERFLQVIETTALHHEEHAKIVLEPGIYRVIQQREYSPEAIRNVAD